jgi:hypothetical protein
MNFNFPQDMRNDLKVNTKKPFTLVLNSIYRSNGNANYAVYNFDWTVFPDVPYYLSFSFTASDNANYVLATASTASIYIDFGESTQTYTCLVNNYGAPSSQYIGSLRKTISSGANYYLFADHKTNPPVYLNGRPNNKSFLIRIFTENLGLYDISMLGSYILTLYFEPV